MRFVWFQGGGGGLGFKVWSFGKAGLSSSGFSSHVKDPEHMIRRDASTPRP